MLSEAKIEEFLRKLLRRGRELDSGDEAAVQQLAHEGAQELQAMLAAHRSTSDQHLGAVEGPIDQVTRLPTPPKPKEDPGELFDPQRDISPG